MDCYQLFSHPAFFALLPLLGFEDDADVIAFRLEMVGVDVVPQLNLTRRINREVTCLFDGDVPGFASNYELYQREEFRTFAKAVGVAYELPTIDLIIDAPGEGQIIRITHTYQGTVSE